MKTELFKSLGFNVSIQVPETVEEYDKLAGAEGAALKDATTNTVYRSVLNVFRSATVDAIEKKTGKERKRTYKLNEAGEQVLDDEQNPIVETEESEAKYIARVLGDDVSAYQSTADEVAATLVFDPKVKERKPVQPKKLAAKFTEAATNLITSGIAEQVAAHLSAKLGIEVDPTNVESLGQAIRADQAKVDLTKQYANVGA